MYDSYTLQNEQLILFVATCIVSRLDDISAATARLSPLKRVRITIYSPFTMERTFHRIPTRSPAPLTKKKARNYVVLFHGEPNKPEDKLLN